MLYAIVALLVIVLDQWTKLWVSTNADLLPYTLIPNAVSLVNAQNPGGAFGFLADKNATVIFIAVAGLVALLTIIALSTNLIKGGLGRWSLVFISAGGLSNAIDRLMSQGKVQDMIKLDFLERVNLFGLKGINFPIFNVADMFITVFCILLILYILFGGNKKAADRYADEDEDEPEEEILEDEDEEEDDRPARRKEKQRRREKPAEPEAKPARSRQGSFEEDYERYKARKSREQKPAPAAEPEVPVVDPQDPFAEWERANQKAAAQKTEAVKPVEAPKPVEEPKPAPAVEAPKPRPAAPAAPAAPKAPKDPAAEEFSLEDILAEFR